MLAKYLLNLQEYKIWRTVPFLMLLVLLGANYSPASASEKESCHLKVGWGDWPPYQMMGKDKKPVGIQIELIRQIAEAAECQLEFIYQNFSDNQKGIKNGSIDLTLDTTITTDREKYAYFSAPYRNEVQVLYVRESFLELCNQHSIEHLIEKGFRLGLTKESLYGDMIDKIKNNQLLRDSLVYHSKNSQLFDSLKQNRIDGFADDPAVIAYMSRTDPTLRLLKSCKLTIKSSPVSLMFSKKSTSPEVVDRFNKALETIKQTDDYLSNWAW